MCFFKLTGEDILQHLIALLKEYLDELSQSHGTYAHGFAEGQKTAYVECLEIIQHWDKADLYGLNWDIEERYPLSRHKKRPESK